MYVFFLNINSFDWFVLFSVENDDTTSSATICIHIKLDEFQLLTFPLDPQERDDFYFDYTTKKFEDGHLLLLTNEAFRTYGERLFVARQYECIIRDEWHLAVQTEGVLNTPSKQKIFLTATPSSPPT